MIITKGDSVQCSQCGSSDSLDVRFAACVATSEWEQVNYPAPNTIVATNDDIRLWRIALCRTCIPSGYRSFLRDRLGKLAVQFGWCSFSFIAAVLAIHFKILRILGPSTAFLVELSRWLFATAMAFALIAGVIGVPVCAMMWIMNFSRLRGLERTGIVPAKRTDKSFVGEGQRIISALVPGRGKPAGKVWGEFSLPEHKTLGQIELAGEEKKKLFILIRDMNIMAVAKTVDEMEKQLPPPWKSLWEQRNKNQPGKGQTQ